MIPPHPPSLPPPPSPYGAAADSGDNDEHISNLQQFTSRAATTTTTTAATSTATTPPAAATPIRTVAQRSVRPPSSRGSGRNSSDMEEPYVRRFRCAKRTRDPTPVWRFASKRRGAFPLYANDDGEGLTACIRDGDGGGRRVRRRKGQSQLEHRRRQDCCESFRATAALQLQVLVSSCDGSTGGTAAAVSVASRLVCHLPPLLSERRRREPDLLPWQKLPPGPERGIRPTPTGKVCTAPAALQRLLQRARAPDEAALSRSTFAPTTTCEETVPHHGDSRVRLSERKRTSQAALARGPLRHRGRSNGGTRRRGDPCRGGSSRREKQATRNRSGGRQHQQHRGQGAITHQLVAGPRLDRQPSPKDALSGLGEASSPIRIVSLWKPTLRRPRPGTGPARTCRICAQLVTGRTNRGVREIIRHAMARSCLARRSELRDGKDPSRPPVRTDLYLNYVVKRNFLVAPTSPRGWGRSLNAAHGHVPALPRSPIDGRSVGFVPALRRVPRGRCGRARDGGEPHDRPGCRERPLVARALAGPSTTATAPSCDMRGPCTHTCPPASPERLSCVDRPTFRALPSRRTHKSYQ
jgi:hypothetical protein